MKMPFPGMDPYLEHPVLWPGVHTQLMVALANQLQPLLRPRYFASIEERVYIEGGQRRFVPDLLVKKNRPAGSVAVAEPATDAPVVLEIGEMEVHEKRIEILDRYQGQKLVTLIEVVSPSNKVRGAGRRSYRAKQRQTFARDVHMVEIDLLRAGRHTLSIPAWRLDSVRPFDYLVCVSRFHRRNRYEVYPRRLRQPLPRINVPLADTDPDVPLDIQAAVSKVYADGGYDLVVKYDEPCEPPLVPEDQTWASECWQSYKAAHPELFPAGN